LTVDNRYAQLFLLRSVKQHAFHFYKLRDPWAVLMAALADGAATGMYAGKGDQEGVCPGVRTSENNRCRNRALWGRTSLSTHAATLAGPLPPRWGWHSGERRGRANSQPDRCRQPSRTWRRKDSLAQVMRWLCI